MKKELTKRIIDGFSYAVAINVVVALICILVFKIEPLVPSYSAYFENKSMALLVQIILTGVISGTFAGGTILFEQAKLGLLLQSLLYFLLTTAVCIPITGFCWGLFVYKTSALIFLCNYSATYFICWTVAYRSSVKEVREINRRIAEISGEENEQDEDK
ncbi:MAG: DUF3021 domain-containing protein [Lachnospiraceae bacterium]|jgi:hypothetical protein|nr:DUF3021 domain-containing protein [Lachnospiraceae bacterium]